MCYPSSKKHQGYECIISKEETDIEWDNFLETTKYGRYEQTSIWASVKGLYGWKHIRIILKSCNKIAGGAQILYKEIFYFGGIGYITKGPIFDIDKMEEVEMILNAICNVAKKFKINLLYINPSINLQTINRILKARRFSPDLFGNFIGATSIIDLEKDVDDLLMQMKKSARRNIKRAREKNILIRKGERHEISDFFLLMSATCKRQGVTHRRLKRRERPTLKKPLSNPGRESGLKSEPHLD